MTPRLPGRRVMIVDDEAMIASLLEIALGDEDAVIVGPFEGVAGASVAARQEAIDFAVLDVNVVGGKVYPVAEILEARGIPFVLLSGYGDGDVPAGREHWPSAAKPFLIEPLIERICAALGTVV